MTQRLVRTRLLEAYYAPPYELVALDPNENIVPGSANGTWHASPNCMSRVLIVDDSEDLVEVYRDALTRNGFEVASTFDGESGLRLVSEFRPNVVLLDMMMPDVDGLEFLARLPASCSPPSPRVIANSGFDGYRAEALSRGAHAFLGKPVTLKVLLAAVAAAVPGEQVPEEKLAENKRQVDASRQKSRTAAAVVIAKLTDEGMGTIHNCLQALVEWLQRYYGFGECFLHLVDGEELYLQASANADPRYLKPGMRYPRSNVYCGDVIDVGSTLYLSDPLHHPVEQFSHHSEVRARGWHFYIGAPLAAKDGTVLGTLCLMDRTPRQMHCEDVRLFETLAVHAATMLTSVAEGRPLERALIDSERVFHRDALDLLLGTGLRRSARTKGRLQVVRFRLRDREDYAQVVRRAYGVTSGLRFAVASAGEYLVLLHDGNDPAIVENNLMALQRMVSSALSGFETHGWSVSDEATSFHGEEPLPPAAAHAISARLLETLGIA